MPITASSHHRNQVNLCGPKTGTGPGRRLSGAARWGALTLLTLLAAAAAALAPAVRAQSVTNSRPGVAVYGTPRVINVGILRLGGPTGQNTAPTYPASGPPTVATDQLRGAYLFYILNQRPDILPAVWTLKNPNAPSHVDADTIARFPTANTGYTQDIPLTQSMAPYWEINGDTITTTLGLSAYDLILITTSQPIAFTLEQRRAVRQFVDKGGTLWIDTTSTGDTAPQLAALLDKSLIFQLQLGGTTISAGTSANDLSHPLATGYYALSSNDLDSLGTGVVGSHPIVSGLSGNNPDATLFHGVNTVTSGAAGANFGSIVAANYGNGHILITDRSIPDTINDNVGLTTGGNADVGTTGNEGGFCGTDYLAAPAADLKFVVNILAWASNADGPSGGGRGDNAQPGATNGAVQSNWKFPLQATSTNTTPSVTGTATYGNRVYVTSDDGYLRCFSVNPGQSLAYDNIDVSTVEGDNFLQSNASATDPVTGVKFSQDYSAGYSYDEIWASDPAGANNLPVSAPVIAEIPVTPQGGTTVVNTPEVLVETAAGVVYASNAVSGHMDATFVGDGGASTFPAGAPIPAPTYYRGRVFATQADGNVRISYSGGQVKTPVATANTEVLSAPFVQSIPGSDMQGYNGDDVVGYVYDTASGSATGPSDIYALFLGSRDEREQYLSYAPAGTSTYSTIQQKLPGLAGLTVYGAPEDTDDSVAGTNWLFDYPFTTSPNLDIGAPLTQATPPPVTTNTITNANAPLPSVYADYDLLPNTTVTTMTRTTINANLAGSATQNAQIQGISVSSVSQGIAASLSNVTTEFNTANNIYATVNENNNTLGYIMSIKERSPSLATSFIAWRFALVSGVTDADGVVYNFGGYHFFGAPVSDGNGYVYALATNTTPANPAGSTILMAFFANAVCGFVAPFTATSVTQTDELGGMESILPTTQYANNTFSNFSSTASGTLQPNLTMPLPLAVMGVSQNGSPAATSEQVAVSTSFGAQPLLAWWVKLPAALSAALTAPSVTPTSPLRKIGDTLYFGGQESTATGGVGGTTTSDYALFGIYADPMGIGLQPDPTTRQIDSSDYRFVQVTPSGIGPVVIPPSGTGKYVITGGGPYTPTGTTAAVPGGIEGLGYTPTLITDNHRLIEMDPSGNATWVVDSTREPLTQTTAAAGTVAAKTVVPLNRPTSVTQFSTDDYLLADTGNNRVIHIGRIGDVLTEFPDKYGHTLLCRTAASAAGGTPNAYALEITGFSDPGGLLAPGASLTLNHPSNVTFWLTYDEDPSVTQTTPPTKITAHYLICDTGNNRIVEVDDTYTLDTSTQFGGTSSSTYDLAQFQDYHHLAWVTKTTENGHAYKYVAAQGLFPAASANYDSLINGPAAILASVGNARVANLTTSATAAPALAPANQDAQGSAVLVLNYQPLNPQTISPYTTQTLTPYTSDPNDGLPFVVVNTVQADGMASGTPPTTPAVTYPLRGLRSVQSYGFIPPTGPNFAGTQLGLVIADDDGVFDGFYNAASATVGAGVLDATTATGGWSFRQDTQPSVMEDDYAPLVTQYDALLDVKSDQPLTGTDASTDYMGTAFSPASALRLGNNTYLIVNRGGSGNPNGVPAFPATGETGTDFGGNVFIVRAKAGANGLRSNGGTLSGVMFGKPDNTSPLDGPSFALRSN